jgi:prepilin-type N-terminal cleavage/methylation domain-containing protein
MQKGFTLIELMIVLAMVVIVLSITGPFVKQLIVNSL